MNRATLGALLGILVGIVLPAEVRALDFHAGSWDFNSIDDFNVATGRRDLSNSSCMARGSSPIFFICDAGKQINNIIIEQSRIPDALNIKDLDRRVACRSWKDYVFINVRIGSCKDLFEETVLRSGTQAETFSAYHVTDYGNEISSLNASAYGYFHGGHMTDVGDSIIHIEMNGSILGIHALNGDIVKFEPWSLFGSHLIQRAFLNIPLGSSDASDNEGEKRDKPSSVSRSTFGAFGWGFLLAASAALVKFALYVVDDPRPDPIQKITACVAWAVAAFCAVHAVFLALMGSWSLGP
jgi:hypothetical protein